MVKAINEHQQAALGVYKTLKDAKIKATVRAITDRLMQKLIDEVVSVREGSKKSAKVKGKGTGLRSSCSKIPWYGALNIVP